MRVLFTTQYKRPYPNSGPNYFDCPDKNWCAFKAQNPKLDTELIERSADYYKVRARWQEMKISIDKKDVPSIIPAGPAFDRALLHCKRYFSYIYTEPNLPLEGFNFVMNTSPGLPFIKLGLHTKTEVVENPEAKQILDDLAFDLSIPVVETCNDKVEFLPHADLTREEPKLRTTFGASMISLFKESYLYARQNENLKKYHRNKSVKYGFRKQYGGFNELAKPHEKYEYRWETDVTGLDRGINLGPVYEVRNYNLNCDTQFDCELRDTWETQVKNPMFLHPDGSIIQCSGGNHSGKLNTTTDNCIALKIVNVYGRVKLFLEQGIPMEDITYQLIEDCTEENYYGDDSFNSISKDVVKMPIGEWEDFVRQYYADFGLKIKPSAVLFTEAMPGDRIDPRHSFLGSFFTYDEAYKMYLPSPRFGKICASITQTPLKRLETMDYFRRLIAIVEHSFPNKQIFDVLSKYIDWHIRKDPVNSGEFIEIVGNMRASIGLRQHFKNLYTGYE